MAGLTEFIKELRRRNVFKVGAAYAIVSWLILQVSSTTFPALHLPSWAFTLVTVLMLIGFPFALLLAWAFELTPEGVKPTRAVAQSESITPRTGKKLNGIVIALLGLAVVFLLLRDYLPSSGEKSAPAASQAGPVAGAAGEGAREPAKESTAKAERPSIAVLPFANRSRSEDDAFFVDGMHDDLLTQLAKVSGLRVISRTSVLSYRDTEKSIPEIGRELNVGNILEGSVQRAGDRIRINVQLIAATTDEHLWAEIYDRELTTANIFEIQSEVATAIARALRTSLTAQEQQRLAVKPTDNLAAYEAFLLGRQRLARRTAREVAAAVKDFNHAIELDGDFALAYVGLAEAYILQVDYGGLALAEANAKSRPLVEKALQLDDQLGEAYNSLASILEYARDYAGAERNYLKATELAPNYSLAAYWYGLFLKQSRGQPAAALPWFQRALELDPLSYIVLINYSEALAELGRFDEAKAMAQKSLEMDPTFQYTYVTLGDYAASEDHFEEAMDWYLRALPLDTEDPSIYGYVADYLGWLGDDANALCWVERGRVLNPESTYVLNAQALLKLYSGDGAAAEALALASIPNIWVPFSKTLPLAIIKSRLQEEGRLPEALEPYRVHFPELLGGATVELDRTNFKAAVDLADVLRQLGREEEAVHLLDAATAYISDIPRRSYTGYWVDDVRIHVLRGENELALAALREAVDSGWRDEWRFYLEHDPILDPIRGDPRFQEMVGEIRADMATQLERVRQRNLPIDICSR